jgi:hypothetical protein
VRGRAALVAGPADGGDLREASDSAVEVRAAVGASVACAVGAAGGGSAVELAPGEVAVGWWRVSPRAGDVALVHDAGALAGAGDDVWHERAVTAAGAGAGVCASGPFAAGGPASGPAGGARWRLALAAPPLPATVGAGSPVRVVRRRRYALYQGGDGAWWLGMREWDADGAQGVQPLAGPFASVAAGGLRATVRDGAGAAVAAGAAGAARVDVRLVAAGRRLGADWRDSAGARLPAAGAGWAP